MPILPCTHLKNVTDQVEPTIKLLTGMDELHPEILKKHGIQPIDYHESLVFRSAIESIRGKFIASSRIEREGLVGDVLRQLENKNEISEF